MPGLEDDEVRLPWCYRFHEGGAGARRLDATSDQGRRVAPPWPYVIIGVDDGNALAPRGGQQPLYGADARLQRSSHGGPIGKLEIGEQIECQYRGATSRAFPWLEAAPHI